MGNCFNSHSAGNVGNSNNSLKQAENEINKQNKEKQDEEKHIRRILLLGTGESGKTTILNQIRKMHGVLRSEHSIDLVVRVIQRNIVKYMALLCIKAEELNINITNKESHEHASKVVKYAIAKETGSVAINLNCNYVCTDKTKARIMDSYSRSHYYKLSSMCPDDVVESVKFLWKNEPALRQVLRNRSKIQIHDNASHFLDSIDRAFDENFDPTDDDILRLRRRTSGFTEAMFTVLVDHDPKQQSNGNLNLIIPNNDNSNIDKYKNYTKECLIFIDGGGHRSERKKWMNVMKHDSQIQAVLYVVAINEFDMTCFEDGKTKRLDEALYLFEKCGDEGLLSNRSVTIFFNKYDLFTAKLESVLNNTNPDQNDFKFYYPDFIGDGTNASQIIDYVFDKFKQTYLKVSMAIVEKKDACGGAENDHDHQRRGTSTLTNGSLSHAISNNLQQPDTHHDEDMLPLYCHHTCAVDTKQMEKLLFDIQLNEITKQLKTSDSLCAHVQDCPQMF